MDDLEDGEAENPWGHQLNGDGGAKAAGSLDLLEDTGSFALDLAYGSYPFHGEDLHRLWFDLMDDKVEPQYHARREDTVPRLFSLYLQTPEHVRMESCHPISPSPIQTFGTTHQTPFKCIGPIFTT